MACRMYIPLYCATLCDENECVGHRAHHPFRCYRNFRLLVYLHRHAMCVHWTNFIVYIICHLCCSYAKRCSFCTTWTINVASCHHPNGWMLLLIHFFSLTFYIIIIFLFWSFWGFSFQCAAHRIVISVKTSTTKRLMQTTSAGVSEEKYVTSVERSKLI